MIVLVWEWLSGGAMLDQPLPSGLLAEGLVMVEALLRDLAAIPDVQPVVLLDRRLAKHALNLNAKVRIHWLRTPEDLPHWLKHYARHPACVWPIAPESGHHLVRQVATLRQQFNTVQALSDDALAVFSDKWASYQWCLAQALPTPITCCYPHHHAPDFTSPWVIKPRWGVGCEGVYYLRHADALRLWAAHAPETTHFLLQPFIDGDALSLSLLFEHGQGQVLSINRQHINRHNDTFVFTGVTINCQAVDDSFQPWLDAISQSFPDLHGFLGIDFLQTPEGERWIVDINPRLTTAYAGLQQATGVNIAAKLLGKPGHASLATHSITVTLDV
ncbi:MAG: ATP-grasp domain-containing protein [Methylococcales bacterium]|nr:ATP-grasp domain-containing protein [Methylococcales bacterium]